MTYLNYIAEPLDGYPDRFDLYKTKFVPTYTDNKGKVVLEHEAKTLLAYAVNFKRACELIACDLAVKDKEFKDFVETFKTEYSKIVNVELWQHL